MFDKIADKSRIEAGSVLIGAVCSLLGAFISTMRSAAVFAVLWGTMLGANEIILVRAYAFDRITDKCSGGAYAAIFGRKHIGSITGFVSGVCTCMTGAGPLLFGLCKQAFGTYRGTCLITEESFRPNQCHPTNTSLLTYCDQDYLLCWLQLCCVHRRRCWFRLF